MLRNRTFHALMLLPAAGWLGCAGETGPAGVLADAAEAMGGRDRILAVQMLVVEGTGENFNLGQNPAPDAELPRFNVTAFRRAVDFERARWRQEQTRTPAFVTANTNPQTQITALAGDVAFNVSPAGEATRAPDAVSRDRQRELLLHPIGFLHAALAPGAVLQLEEPDSTRQIVHLARGTDTYSLTVDRATRLPVSVSTRVSNANLGDVVLENAYADYRDTDGLQLPMRVTTRLDRFVTADIRLTSASVSGQEATDLEAPESVRSATPPAPAVNVAVEELAPGVWYIAGGSHHSVLIEFADHMMVVEAPQSEARTRAALAAARQQRPEKPLRYLVNTHHHFDHSGGIRTAIAEGLTIVTHAGNEAWYREVAGRAFTISPDSLARAAPELQIEAVADRRVYQDASRTVEVHALEGNAHSATMLVVYLPRERLLIEADVYSPPAAGATNVPPAIFAPNLVENVTRLNLRPANVVPIHGRVVPWADVVAAARAAAQ
jgi:glyoxylase-like metal-dependent hydrolase (beta-lactamase superfamily II)